LGRITGLYANFNAGEWDPTLHGRMDLEKYRNACSRMLNIVPDYNGSAKRRPGTRFVKPSKSNQVVRLVPFEFSTEQAYVLEFGDLYTRVFKDRGVVETAPNTSYEFVTLYPTASLPFLKWAQSADVMYMVDGLRTCQKITRTGHTNWTTANLVNLDGPYLEINTTTTTMTPSATTGAITITASAATFAATDVGRLIRIQHGTTWGYAKITTFTSNVLVSATVVNSFGGTTAVKNWRLGAWSDTTGWPSCVTFYEERLYFAGTRSQPQTLWASVVGDYENFAPSKTDGVVTADSAITFTISDDRVNAITWLSAGLKLGIGTIGGEFIAQASTLNEALTPDNITVRRQSTIGSANMNPVRVNQAVLFVQRLREKVYEFAYDVLENNATVPEVSILSRHLTRRRIREIAYQQNPNSIMWACADDGSLLGFTYLREQDVVGWHPHALGGANVKVLSLCCIPGTTQDELWMCVERTVNNTTVRYIEYMTYDFQPINQNDKYKMIFVDSSLEYSGGPITTVNGLTHLVGQTVQVLANGAAHPDKFVNNAGQIELDYPATNLQVGLGYKTELETLDLEGGSQDGTALGKKKRVHKITVWFYNTLGGKVGLNDAVDEVLTRDPSMPMDQSPPIFTGVKVIQSPYGWDYRLRVKIVMEQPLPITILAIAPTMTVVEG